MPFNSLGQNQIVAYVTIPLCRAVLRPIRPDKPVTRIAIAFEYPTLNGGEQSMLAVLEEFSTEPLDLVAIAPSRGPLAERLADLGIPIEALSLQNADGGKLPPQWAGERLLTAVRRVAPDLLHANSLSMGRLTGRIRSDLRIPTVAHLRDIIRLSAAARSDINRNDRLLAVSQATRDFHINEGLSADRVQVLYNGVDCQRFTPRSSDGWLHAELGLPRDSMLLAIIGQIGLRKAHDVLADACALLSSRLGDVSRRLHLLVIGERFSQKPESVEFERSFFANMQSAGWEGRVHALGYRSDIERILPEIDLLVHPARQEPLGRVLLEGAACGRAIVATNVGGTAEIVTDHASALLISPDHPQELAFAIASLIVDESQRRQLGTAARATIVRRFSQSQSAAGLKLAWNDLLT